MYCFSCFGEAHGDFFTRNNLFILNFTLKKKINCNEKLFFKMLYLASGAGAEGNSVPLGGGGPRWDIWESFLCVQLCGAAERQGLFACSTPSAFSLAALRPAFLWEVEPEPWGCCRTDVTTCHLSGLGAQGEAWQGAEGSLWCCRVN